MTGYHTMEQRLLAGLGLRRRPVAVGFRASPPAGVSRLAGTQPSGCSFWRLAASGQTFYTVPSDHYNCPIGCYTHNIALPTNRAQELDQTLALMVGIGYLRMEEVPGIPRLPETPGVVVYAPLGETPVDPDVVLFAGRPGQVMLLQETALRIGRAIEVPLMGRPTCAILPAAVIHGVLGSTGCIGNRVYTDLGEDELYVAVAGPDVSRIADEALTVHEANVRLAEYHHGRRVALSSDTP
jgi:uncharacterized protein (DUF169 family)